jgi:hypothetical protein
MKKAAQIVLVVEGILLALVFFTCLSNKKFDFLFFALVVLYSFSLGVYFYAKRRY